MAEELIGIIGGSGLGDALTEELCKAEKIKITTPFGKCSDSILLGKFGNKKVAFLNRHGQGHKLTPHEVPFAANIFALKELGVRAIIASGAVGSLREEIAPKDLIIVDQIIDKTFRQNSSFFDGFGAVHCEMAHPTCGRLRRLIAQTAKQIDVNTHESGTYVCMQGPQFSTRAESLMHRQWGADLIGMTAMPEAKLAREAQICYALIALASDYDCWQQREAEKDRQTLLKEIIGNLQQATNNAIKLIKAVLQKNTDAIEPSCHCRRSLELAVWTKQDKINKKKRDSLKVLFE